MAMRFFAYLVAWSTIAIAASGAAAQTVQVAASTPDAATREIRAIVEGAARNDAEWRKQADDFIRGERTSTFGNRAHAGERAVRLLEAIDARCRMAGDCVAGRQMLGAASIAVAPTHEVARIAKANVCAAYPIDAVGVRRWDVPPGSLAFDFQPSGRRPTAGAMPVVPGDGRLIGGARGLSYADDYALTGDSVTDVRGFSTAVPSGRLRIILLGSTRARTDADRLPFGSQIQVNGRSLDVLGVSPSHWLRRGILAGPNPDQSGAAANLLPGSAPAIVFEADGEGGRLTLGFPSGVEVGALIVESAERPSSFLLDAAAPNAVSSDATCLGEQEKIDRALAKLPSGRVSPQTPTVQAAPTKPPAPASALSPS